MLRYLHLALKKAMEVYFFKMLKQSHEVELKVTLFPENGTG